MADDQKDKQQEEQKEQNLIVIKKINKGGHGHHGGAWKIAFADFATAMMAFFLLMWLISSLNKYQKEGIAEYFKNPTAKVFYKSGSLEKKDDLMVGGGHTVSDAKTTLNPQKNPPEITQEQLQEHIENLKDNEKLEELKKQIEQAINNDPSLEEFKKHISVDVVENGLRVRLTDIENKPMFASGSAVLNATTENVIMTLAETLNKVNNKIIIIGYTDAKPYSSGATTGYTNWELSVDRANATRRALIKGGLNKDQIIRISGMGSTDPLDKDDPFSPINRRINIFLLNKNAEKQVLKGL